MEALRRSVGGAAAETKVPEEVGQEAAEGVGRPEGNADVDPRQEAGQGRGREEAGGQATEVGLDSDAGPLGRWKGGRPFPIYRWRRRTWRRRPNRDRASGSFLTGEHDDQRGRGAAGDFAGGL
jgi:hypothetical protein